MFENADCRRHPSSIWQDHLQTVACKAFNTTSIPLVLLLKNSKRLFMAGVGGVHSACMARSFWLFLLASRPSLSTPFVLASLLRPCPQRTTIQPTQATFLSTRTEFRHTLVFQRKQGSFIRRKTTSMVAAAKLEAPASERNKDPIWNVLKTFLVSSKVSQKTNSDNTAQSPVRVLEIAAGTGGKCTDTVPSANAATTSTFFSQSKIFYFLCSFPTICDFLDDSSYAVLLSKAPGTARTSVFSLVPHRPRPGLSGFPRSLHCRNWPT